MKRKQVKPDPIRDILLKLKNNDVRSAVPTAEREIAEYVIASLREVLANIFVSYPPTFELKLKAVENEMRGRL